jgi:hypothetical protein
MPGYHLIEGIKMKGGCHLHEAGLVRAGCSPIRGKINERGYHLIEEIKMRGYLSTIQTYGLGSPARNGLPSLFLSGGNMEHVCEHGRRKRRYGFNEEIRKFWSGYVCPVGECSIEYAQMSEILKAWVAAGTADTPERHSGPEPGTPGPNHSCGGATIVNQDGTEANCQQCGGLVLIKR